MSDPSRHTKGEFSFGMFRTNSTPFFVRLASARSTSKCSICVPEWFGEARLQSPQSPPSRSYCADAVVPATNNAIAIAHRGRALADRMLRNPTTGIAGCCARTTAGHAAAPPSAAINSRRLIRGPRRRGEKLGWCRSQPPWPPWIVTSSNLSIARRYSAGFAPLRTSPSSPRRAAIGRRDLSRGQKTSCLGELAVTVDGG